MSQVFNSCCCFRENKKNIFYCIFAMQGRSKGSDSPAMAGPVLGKKEKKRTLKFKNKNNPATIEVLFTLRSVKTSQLCDGKV